MIRKLKDMTTTQKIYCYNTFIDKGNYDTFEGFCNMLSISTFNLKTGEPVEVKWTTPLECE